MNPSAAAKAAEALGIAVTSTPDEVNTAYRSKAKECHPDAGAYDPVVWSNITWARKTLLAYIEQGPPPAPRGDACRVCSGEGHIIGRRSKLRMTCAACQGRGTTP